LFFNILKKLELVHFFIFIEEGKASKKLFHQFVFNILVSNKITIHLSSLVLISLQNHCFNLIIAFGTEYSKKGSLKNTLLAINIGSVGTEKGNLCITKYFRLSPGISIPSQKLSVHNSIEFFGSFRKKLNNLILLQAIHCAYKFIQSFFNSQFKDVYIFLMIL
jgi:succinate dehydrogenase hydrophobic anchor subunit